MKVRSWMVAALTLLFCSGEAIAATPDVKIGGQVRPRAVADSGRDFQSEGIFEREHINQRARLWADVGLGPGKAWARVMVQDVRTWGEETSPVHDRSAQGLDIQEAFFVVPTALGLTLKVGRQELIYDNHRLIGNIGWLQRAQSFDGVRATMPVGSLTLDGFAVMLRERDEWDLDGTASGAKADARLAGLQLRYAKAKTIRASLSYFMRDNEATEETRHTVGGIAALRFGGTKVTAEAYYQLGSVGKDSIGAWLAALDARYHLDNVPTKPIVAVFCDVVSGDGTVGGAFDTLHATNHKFYGEMDIFLALPKHTANNGLIDAGLRLVGRSVGPLKLLVTAHQFMAVTSNDSGAATYGQEVDVKVVAQLTDGVGLRALWGVFLPDEALRPIRGVADGVALTTEHFSYLTIDAKF